MSLSVDHRPAETVSAADLLTLASDPAKYRSLLDQLKELHEGQAALTQRMTELEIRESAAAALAAEAGRIKADYLARAARLEAVLGAL